MSRPLPGLGRGGGERRVGRGSLKSLILASGRALLYCFPQWVNLFAVWSAPHGAVMNEEWFFGDAASRVWAGLGLTLFRCLFLHVSRTCKLAVSGGCHLISS